MILPRRLQTGDKLAIVATARKINPGDLDLGIKVFQSWGLNVILGDHIYSDQHSYLAGTEEERLQDLQTMIDDASIAAIVAARGGYGTTQILDDVDLCPLQKAPKWIVGFSDITSLHLALFREGIASVHGAMPALFSKPEAQKSIESLGRLLMEGNCDLQATPSSFNRPGRVDGVVIGGNLSLIADSLGTESEPDTRGKILFIEEVDEYLYKIDRLLTQLKRAGKLRDLRALLVGHMSDLKDSELSYGRVYQEIVMNVVRQYDYPVAFNIPCGHEHPNFAFIHGGHATLEISDVSTSLTFDRLR